MFALRLAHIVSGCRGPLLCKQRERLKSPIAELAVNHPTNETRRSPENGDDGPPRANRDNLNINGSAWTGKKRRADGSAAWRRIRRAAFGSDGYNLELVPDSLGGILYPQRTSEFL